MHTFQPYPVELLEMNPFIKIGKEWALVTAGDKNDYNTMTVSWGGIGVLWGKNVVYIFIRESRHTKKFIDKGEFFSLSFLGDAYKEALTICGKKSGRDCDKFVEANLTPTFKLSIPYPDESNLVMLCKKMAAVPITEANMIDPELMSKWYTDNDMHTMYVGEILEVLAR